MKLSISVFSGIIPRFSPELLKDSYAVTAENLTIKSGKIHPEKQFSFKTPRYDYVPGQINDDQYNRLYFYKGGTFSIYGTLEEDYPTEYSERPVYIPVPSAVDVTVVAESFETKFEDVEFFVNYSGGTVDAFNNFNPVLNKWQLAGTDDEPVEWVKNGDVITKTFPFRPFEIMYVVSDSGGSTQYIWHTGCGLYSNVTFMLDGGTYTMTDGTAAVQKTMYDRSGDECGSYYISVYGDTVSESGKLVDGMHSSITRGSELAVYGNSITRWMPYDVPLGTSSELASGGRRLYTGKPGNPGGINTGVEEIFDVPCNCVVKVERNYTTTDHTSYYLARLVDDIGQEGDPSGLSEDITVRPDEYANLTVRWISTGNDHLDLVRIYRTGTGNNYGSDYLFCKEVSTSGATATVIGGTTFMELTVSDELKESELNEPMPKYGAPRENLDGLVAFSGGFMAGFKGKDIYFTEPYLPYIMPWDYSVSVPFEIIGMETVNNYLYVMTKGGLYAFVGSTPEDMTPIDMSFDIPCISRKSICTVNGTVIYAGSMGLCQVGGRNARVISDGFFTIEQYKALHLENCIASGEYDNKYMLRLAGGTKTLLFDFGDGTPVLTTLNSTAVSGGTYSHDDGSWAAVAGGTVGNSPYGKTQIAQDFSSSNLTATWHSKDYVFERPVAFSAVKARFSGGTIGFKLYGNGSLVHTGTITNSMKAQRLPILRRENRWSVEVNTTCDVDCIELAESMKEL